MPVPLRRSRQLRATGPPVRALSTKMLRDAIHVLSAMYPMRTLDACVAGGFAAWSLERRLETRAGMDAVPRSRAMLRSVGRRAVWRQLWIPEDVDVFAGCTSTTSTSRSWSRSSARFSNASHAP